MGRETTRTSDRVRPSRRTRLFIVAVFAALLAIAPVAAQTRTALVDHVIDGDTFRVRTAGAPYTVRTASGSKFPDVCLQAGPQYIPGSRAIITESHIASNGQVFVSTDLET